MQFLITNSDDENKNASVLAEGYTIESSRSLCDADKNLKLDSEKWSELVDEYQKTNRQEQFRQQVTIAGIKGAGKGSGNKYSISTSDYKEALKRIGEIEAYYEEKRAENPDFKLPSSMQEEWEELNSIKRAYRSERNNGVTVSNSSAADDGSNDTTEAVDWNDWNSINAGIN